MKQKNNEFEKEKNDVIIEEEEQKIKLILKMKIM